MIGLCRYGRKRRDRRASHSSSNGVALLAIVATLAAPACSGEWPSFGGSSTVEVSGGQQVVAFLMDGPEGSLPAEEAAALEWLRSVPTFAVEAVQIIDLPRARLPEGTVLWWHYAEGPGLSSAAVRPTVMSAVRRHLAGDGGVLLTSLAAPYVVPLGLETEPPDRAEIFAFEEGAEAPVGGPQSNLGHPVLRRFWGGTLTASYTPGQSYATAVYSGDRWPAEGRVWALRKRGLGVDPGTKAGVEYPPTAERPGGSLLTLGADCHFADPWNRYRRELELLITDAIDYLAGKETALPAGIGIASAGAPLVSASDSPIDAGVAALEAQERPTTDPQVAALEELPLPTILTETSYWNRESLRTDILVMDAPATTPPIWSDDPAVLDALRAARSGLELTREDPGEEIFTLASTRAHVVGSQSGRIDELWVHPLRLLRNLRFGVAPPGEPVIWLDSSPGERVFTVRPEGNTLSYSNDSLEVELHVALDRTRPAMLILFEIQYPTPVEVVATWEPDSRPSRPYEPPMLGPLYVDWDDGAHLGVWRDRSGAFNAIAGFGREPSVVITGFQPTLHLVDGRLVPPAIDQPAVDEPLAMPTLAIQVPFDPARESLLPFVVVGGMVDNTTVRQALDAVFAEPAAVWATNAAHFREVLATTLEITTPDPEFDAAFRWAKIGLEASRAAIPGFGAGLVRGFSAPVSAVSADSTGGEDIAPDGGAVQSSQEGAADYWGRDAVWAGLAADTIGRPGLTREALQFLARYQDASGRIPEVVSPSWGMQYEDPESTLLFLVGLEHHVRTTADADLLAALWPAALAALDFSLAADLDNDGLLDTAVAGRDWTVSGSDPELKSGFYLNGLWAAALQACTRLAAQMGDPVLAATCAGRAATTRQVLNTELWDATGRTFYHGIEIDGLPRELPTIMPTALLSLQASGYDLLDSALVMPLLDRAASAEMSTDWGVRMIEASNPLYDPADLRRGAVSPVFTGWTSLAEYGSHRVIPAQLHLFDNLRLYPMGNLGYLGDAFNGDVFLEGGRLAQQVSSQALSLLPVVRGLLGIKVDALQGHLEIVPQIPAEWDRLSASPIRVGEDSFRLTVSRTPESMRFLLERLSGSRPIRLTIGARVASDVLINLDRSSTTGVSVETERIDPSLYDTAAIATLVATEPRAEVVFRHGSFPQLSPEVLRPEAGATSEGLRIVQSTYRGGVMRLSLEGLPGHAYTLTLTTPLAVSSVAGVPEASIVNPGPGQASIRAVIPGSGDRYHRVEMEIYFRR